MIKSSLLLLLFFTFSINLSAQTSFTAKGKIVDKAAELSLENAVVTVLYAKDSILVDFTRTGKDGSFIIDKLPVGDYILMASYPKYIDFVEEFSIDSTNTSVDMGTVNMLLVSNLLSDVVITGKNAITIKGDTIEFDASKYTIQPNSKVEDLLAQLPGIQIDKDGKITAQGETVTKVLVDGEEFFGDDPTLVTKNIRGDMVDKVQLYDKKSDQAEFTGIDDGEKEKTINIQLKEDSKNGMFGKVDAGIATEDLFQGQAMFNTFKGSQKFAAYGTTGNTGTIGLDWRDNEKYASSGSVEINDGGIMISGGSGRDELDSFNGRYNGQGIPLAYSGGAHYDSKWNDKKESINANYKIGSLEVDGNRGTFDQNTLPTGVIISESSQDFNDFMFRQKLDARYEIAFDTTSTLKVSINGGLKHTRSDNFYESESMNKDDLLLNQSSRNINNEGDSKSFGADVLWNKKLRKKGRTLSIRVRQTLDDDDTEGFLNAQNDYYGSGGVLDSTQLIDQQKINNTNTSVFSSNIVYTEPIVEHLTLAFDYRFNLNNGTSNLLSYNKSPSGAYNELDSLYSNDFKLDQLSNQLGATLNYNNDKNQINVGLSAADVNFKQVDRFSDDVLKRSFVNLNPNARWTHKFSQQKSFRFNYSGNTTQPSLNQIQPVQGNLDPLNISVGNPNLDPAFRHSLNLGYNSYKMLSGEYFGLSMYGSLNSNAIISNRNTDAVGKTIYKYENLKDHMPSNLSAYLYYGSKIKGIDLNVGGSLNYNGNSYYNITNDELNKTESNSYSAYLDIRKYVQKKYSFYFSAGPTYSSNVASLQKERSSKGLGFNGRADFQVFLPAKFEVFSDASYSYSPATDIFAEEFERLLWNGGIRKKFLKTDALAVSIRANDILNQNVGFNRNASENRITESSYTTIKRYFMFSVTWDFNKMGGKP